MSEPATITALEWEEEGRMFARRLESSTWALGDWLIKGDVLGHDPKFRESARITGYTPDHLYGLRLQAQIWPAEDRAPSVSWAVHRVISAERDPVARRALLKRAVEARWTQAKATEVLRAEGIRAQVRPDAHTPITYKRVQVCCPNCQHVFDVKGHKVTGEPAAKPTTEPEQPDAEPSPQFDPVPRRKC